MDNPLDDSYPDPDDDYPYIDPPNCQLMGPTALAVQALMGVLVLLSLAYKRHRESPKRPWRIWLFDVSKQVVGQLFVHGVNVLISDAVQENQDSNACVYYFLNILIDTTLGVGLIYLVLHLLTFLFTEKFGFIGFQSGIYGDPPSSKFWFRQAALYVFALTTMKFLVIGLLQLFPGLDMIGEWLLSWTWTEKGDALQVIFVMGIFPIAMNILQFWLIDTIVKAKPTPLTLDTNTFGGPDEEPLFGAPSDDEDDPPIPHYDIENTRPPPLSRSTSVPTIDTSISTDANDDPKQRSPGLVTPGENVKLHAYPPNSTSQPALKRAPYSEPQRQRPPDLLNLAETSHSTSSLSKIPVAPISAEEWANSWGEEDDDVWGDHNPKR